MTPPLHRRQALPVARRARVAFVVTTLLCPGAPAGCADRESDSAELTVVLDSTRSGPALEAVIVPRDPAPLLTAPPVAGTGPRADSVARWRALADSAAALDRRFQVERDAINHEVRTMDRGDRRSAAYARRFDALTARTAAAESLRALRDRLRRRAESMRPAGARTPPGEDRAALLRSSDGARVARAVRLTNRVATVRLPAGEWWIGVGDSAGVPDRFTRVELRAGGRVSVRPQ